MKKLVSVKIEFEFVMLSDSSICLSNAQEFVREAIRDTPSNYISTKVTPFDPLNLPFGWDEDCHPYGGTGTTKYHLENPE